MRDAHETHYAGLDIGTSAVRCIVGVIDQEQSGSKLRIIGHGQAESVGMRKGTIIHLEEMAESIREAKRQAEELAGVPLDHVTCNINGSHIVGVDSRGVIAISSHDREIREDDRFRAEEAATILKLPPNQEIVQVFAKSFRVDGQSSIKDPVGMHGVRLEADTHLVVAASPNVKATETVLEKAGLTPDHITVSSLASAEAVLERQQKEAGTLVINIGAGTTNMVIIEDGEVQYVGVLPVGGMHITNDLAIGLRTDLDIAETVKIEHGTLESVNMGSIEVTKGEVTEKFQKHEVKNIIEARVEELLELVERELKKIGRSRKLPGGVVITGGTSKLPGIATLTKDKLQLAARVGQIQPIHGLIDEVNDACFATAIGLMQLDVLLTPVGVGRIDMQDSSKLLQTASSAFRKLIKKRKK